MSREKEEERATSDLFRRLDEVVPYEQAAGCVEHRLGAGQQLTGVTRAARRQEGRLLVIVVTALLRNTVQVRADQSSGRSKQLSQCQWLFLVGSTEQLRARNDPGGRRALTPIIKNRATDASCCRVLRALAILYKLMKERPSQLQCRAIDSSFV